MNPKPQLEPLPEKAGDLYRLAKTYRVKLPVDGRELTILLGYETDGASIPRILWRMAHPFQSRFVAASIVHDALYSAELLPRHRTDRIFFQMLREDRVPRWKAAAMWFAVRSFGWIVWRTHTARSIRKAGRLVFLSFPAAAQPNDSITAGEAATVSPSANTAAAGDISKDETVVELRRADK